MSEVLVGGRVRGLSFGLLLALWGAMLALLSGPGGALAAEESPLPALGGEVVSARTATSRTYELEDGGQATKVWAGAVNVRDAAGDFQPIDTTLQSDGAGGVTGRRTVAETTLPRELGDGPVRVSDGGRWASFRLVGAGATAVVAGSTARFRDAVGSTDASYAVLSDGVKETLTIDDADAPSEYRFALDATAGLVAKLGKDGSVRFVDADGKVRFLLPAPTAQAADEHAPSGDHVAFELSQDGSELKVAVDRAWLASASLPVQVDPTLVSSTSTGCTLTSGASAAVSSCGGSTLQLGHDTSSSPTRRIALKLPGVSAVPQTASIVGAYVGLTYQGQTATGAAPDVDVKAIAKPFATGATWNTYDGTNAWTTAGGDTSGNLSRSQVPSSSIGDVARFDVSDIVQGWVRGATNQGLLMSLKDETFTDTLTFTGPGAATDRPFVLIDWERHPGLERDGTYASQAIDDRSSAAVNVASGNMALTAQDMTVPGVAGFNLSLGRFYNASDDLVRRRVMADWWGLSVNGASLSLELNAPAGTSRILRTGSGAVYRFDRDPANDNAGTGDLAYVTPPGIDADMVTRSTGKTEITFRGSGVVWRYDENFPGSLESVKDAHGNEFKPFYATVATGDVEPTEIRDGAGNTVVTLAYDFKGALTKVTDQSGRHWDYSQPTVGSTWQLSTVTNPDGKVTGYSYDATTGRLKQVTDGRGNLVKFAYATGSDGDPAQVASMTRTVDGSTQDVVTTLNYLPGSGTGHACVDATVVARTVQTDPRGKLTTYCYNANAQAVETWDALSRKQTQGYNAQSNVINAADAAGGTANPVTLNYATNLTHNFKDGIEGSGETFSQTYCVTPPSSTNTCSGGVTGSMAMYKPQSFTDEQGSATKYDYNAAGDLTKANDAQSPTIASLNLTYNTDGTIATSQDSNGNTTTYTYTAHNLTAITPPSSSTLIGATTLTYDSLNRVKAVTDGLGTVSTLTYDGEDRVKNVAYSNGRAFAITFDENGNPTQRLESLSGSTVNTTTYAYDKLNRRTSESFPGSVTNTYGYDKNGNLASLTDTGGKTTYAYDDINRLSTLTSPKTGTADCAASPTSCDSIAYAYTDLATGTFTPGPTTRQTASMPGANVKQVIEANASGRPTSINVTTNAGTVLQGSSFAYTASSSPQRALIQSVTQQPANTTTNYTYGTGTGTGGNTGALLRAQTKNSSSTVTDQWDYAYDRAGNRTSRTRSVTSPATTSYAYNAANEMCWAYTGTSAAACTSPPGGATTYTYDHAGNQTTGNTYDALSRTTATTGVTGSLAYLTPGNQELTGVGSTTLQNALLGLMRQVPSSGSATAYTRTPGGTPVAQRTSTAKQYLYGDQLGSITAIADNNTNALTRTYTYDPDGNRTTATSGGSGATTDLALAGGYTLPGGLIHYGARYYNPTQARWTQPDSQSTSSDYTYAAGNPLNAVDLAGTTPYGPGTASCCTAAYNRPGPAAGGVRTDGDSKLTPAERAIGSCLLSGVTAIPAGRAYAIITRAGASVDRTNAVGGCFSGLGISVSVRL